MGIVSRKNYDFVVASRKKKAGKNMRQLLKNVFKTYFHRHLIRTRGELALTQQQMADLLAMAERSFIDLDHGKCSCSGATLALYLSYCCDDPLKFLEDFKTVYEKEVDAEL